ncbi:MAG: sigma-54-dependent Fis family transcriptional regulator [Magnetococcales bacterium]|nr:sigma-54-dependent Fis family transcriptional regulator [Magnetococcales bacterium]|tara:strand:+ start:21807 stop:23165 length:1359 start_codon:yes stop_codon:yes gene_type:complete
MAKQKLDIFIIDDDPHLAEMLLLHFEDLGYSCQSAQSGRQAKEKLAGLKPKIFFLDQHLPDTLGITLLPELKDMYPETPVLMITGKHDMELAIEAIKLGATDYIHKPIDIEELNASVEKCLSPKRTKKDMTITTHDEKAGEPRIIGSSRKMIDVVKQIALASTNDATVLIQGETGTGKELVAKAIHYHSGKEGAFLAVNCGAIVENLLESEMFGHEKGAFTGAAERKEGKFALAQNGTLFLDEIGELSPKLQSKLLRVLQEGTFERVGGSETLTTNAHIVAATHRDLDQMIADGLFREDLMYRLKIMTVHVPPLRERVEDIKLLTPYLLAKINQKIGKNITGMTDDAYYKLEAHSWPGNVRELENVLTRACAMNRTGIISADQIVIEYGADSAGAHDLDHEAIPLVSLEELERRHVTKTLERTGGHKGQACDILGISRPALDRKIKKFKIQL